MKKTLWLALVVLATVPTAWAQNTRPQRPDPQQRTERMEQALDYRLDRLALTLDLTNAQKAQIREIMEAKQREHQAQAEQQRAARQNMTREQRQAMAEQRRAEMEARRTAMEQKRTQTEAAIRAVLNAEQARKFDALRALDEAHRAEMRERRGERMEQRGERMEQRGERMEQRGERMKERGHRMQRDGQH